MTLLDDAPALASDVPGSSSRPVTDARGLLRRLRLPGLLLGLLAVAGLLFSLTTGPTSNADLDPAGVTQGGSRAVARLLADRGVEVTRVPQLDQAGAGEIPATIFVPSAARVGGRDLDRLTDLARRTDIVVVLDGPADLVALGADGDDDGLVPGFDREHEPGCGLPAAVAAGGARTGMDAIRLPAGLAGLVVTDRCYLADGEPTVLVLRAPNTAGSLTLLTSSELVRNDRLAQDGNAALALGLLDRGRPLTWLLPLPGEVVDDTGEPVPLADLLPDRLLLAALELLVLLALLAVWRGRRLGPVVVEPLPVVVRSVETVFGRARLYRGAKARDRAALALREAARARAARRLGLGAETPPRVLIEAVAAQAGRAPADVATLLYGAPAPPDDSTLVRLADELDTLTKVLLRAAPPPAPPPAPREAPSP